MEFVLFQTKWGIGALQLLIQIWCNKACNPLSKGFSFCLDVFKLYRVIEISIQREVMNLCHRLISNLSILLIIE